MDTYILDPCTKLLIYLVSEQLWCDANAFTRAYTSTGGGVCWLGSLNADATATWKFGWPICLMNVPDLFIIFHETKLASQQLRMYFAIARLRR